MSPRIALPILAVIAGTLPSCTTGPPTPNPEQEKILKVFRITGLTKVFPIHASLDEALSAPGETAPEGAAG